MHGPGDAGPAQTERIDIECVVRGYLAGSAWAEYRQRHPDAPAASPCPLGLRESDRLPEPIFTPATKAASGHDENIIVRPPGRPARRWTSPTTARRQPGPLREAAAQPKRAAS